MKSLDYIEESWRELVKTPFTLVFGCQAMDLHFAFTVWLLIEVPIDVPGRQAGKTEGENGNGSRNFPRQGSDRIHHCHHSNGLFLSLQW